MGKNVQWPGPACRTATANSQHLLPVSAVRQPREGADPTPWSHVAGRSYRYSVLRLLSTYLLKALYLEQCGWKQGSYDMGSALWKHLLWLHYVADIGPRISIPPLRGYKAGVRDHSNSRVFRNQRREP